MDPVPALFWLSEENSRLRSLGFSSLEPQHQKNEENRRRQPQALPRLRCPKLTQTAGTSSTQASSPSATGSTPASSSPSTSVRRTRASKRSSPKATSRCAGVIKVMFCANLVESPQDYDQLFQYFVVSAPADHQDLRLSPREEQRLQLRAATLHRDPRAEPRRHLQ